MGVSQVVTPSLPVSKQETNRGRLAEAIAQLEALSLRKGSDYKYLYQQVLSGSGLILAEVVVTVRGVAVFSVKAESLGEFSSDVASLGMEEPATWATVGVPMRTTYRDKDTGVCVCPEEGSKANDKAHELFRQIVRDNGTLAKGLLRAEGATFSCRHCGKGE